MVSRIELYQWQVFSRHSPINDHVSHAVLFAEFPKRWILDADADAAQLPGEDLLKPPIPLAQALGILWHVLPVDDLGALGVPLESLLVTGSQKDFIVVGGYACPATNGQPITIDLLLQLGFRTGVSAQQVIADRWRYTQP